MVVARAWLDDGPIVDALHTWLHDLRLDDNTGR